MSLNLRLLLALLMALILTILPLPEIVADARPPWILLLILSVQFFFPSYFHIISVFIIGLCLDVLLTTVTGEHSFALVLTTWIASSKARRFRFYTIGQQIALIGIFCLVYESLLFLMDSFLGYHTNALRVFWVACGGLFFWPWIVSFAYGARRTHRTSR